VDLFGVIEPCFTIGMALNGMLLFDVDFGDAAWSSQSLSADGVVTAAISVLLHLLLIFCIFHISTLHMSD